MRGWGGFCYNAPMSEFKALYSKYRPKKFKDVLGQDHITNVLAESIKLGNIAHAYLFSGTRGTGKTSVARILAHEIGTSDDDLYEIDAASNNGVDEIRSLNEAVSTLPFSSPYKVYILDEVHMLSKGAFNALLKTLEEPPSHVIFVLATTEPHKVPDTVISRCESYTFKKPSQKLLKQVVQQTAKEEGFTLDPASADLIALLGDGSFRDTHGILQKVINSSKDKRVSLEEVEKVTGAPNVQLVNDLIDSISDKDKEKALQTIAKAVDQNIDMKIYLSLILEKVRAALLVRYSKSMLKKLEESMTEEDLKKVEEWAGNKEINSATLKTLLDAYLLTGSTYLPQVPLELAIIELS
jgi:DNA polymerase-3 subunit gamma/tau